MLRNPIAVRPTARSRLIRGLLAASILLTTPASAMADCTTCYEWSLLALQAGRPTTPLFVDGVVIHAIDGDIALRRPGDGSAAAVYPNSGIWRTPAMALLPDPDPGHWYVFAASTDGYLYKLDVPDPLPGSGTVTLQIATTGIVPQNRDLRRAACPTDTLLAEPVVQRRADSNAQFTLDQDIVMVATAHACGDTTQNLVAALDAADLSQPPVWVFNSGEYEIGRIRTCLLDIARNLLFCTAEHPPSSFQPGVFAIDTNTGSLVWSAIFDTGAHVRPALGAPGGPGDGHLYVGDELGRFHQLNLSSGSDEASAAIGVAQNTPATTETFTLAAYQSSNGTYRLVGTLNDPDTGERTTQFRVPCVYASSLCVPEWNLRDGFEGPYLE